MPTTCLQETWLRIHEVRHTYRPGEPVLPWIYAIARHTRVDHYRKTRRVEDREQQVEVLPERPAPSAPESRGPDLDAMLRELAGKPARSRPHAEGGGDVDGRGRARHVVECRLGETEGAPGVRETAGAAMTPDPALLERIAAATAIGSPSGPPDAAAWALIGRSLRGLRRRFAARARRCSGSPASTG